MRIFKRKAQGTITVFLSLILLLILALLCTIIEGARVSTAKVFADRALTTAMDSILAQYYEPLWEEYHIFGYNAGEDRNSEQNIRIASDLSDYMSYTFSPDKNLEGVFNEGGVELYDISLENIQISNKADMLDYEGQLFINEAVEYMKYKEIGNGIESLLDKLSLMEEPNKVSYIMEEKQKVEEELVEIDQGILDLMELFDGLETSEKGIELTKDGLIRSTDNFIKKICIDEVSMVTVGINNEIIFDAQKNKYINPDTYFTKIDNYQKELIQISSQIDDLLLEKEDLSLQLSQEQEKLRDLNSISEKTEEDKRQIKELKQLIKDLNATIDELDVQIKEQSEQKSSLITSITEESNAVSQLIGDMKSLIHQALTSIDKIIAKSEAAAPLLEQYEAVLTSQKENLSEDIYSGLEEELKELKKYVATDESSYNFSEMKTILQDNLYALDLTQDEITEADTELENEDFTGARYSYEAAGSALIDYQISGLTLDYSTLAYDKSKQRTPLDEVSNLLQSGLTSLVLDPQSISDSELHTSELLPSEIAAMTEENTDFLSKLSTFFSNAVIGGQNSGIGSLFGDFANDTQFTALAEEGINSLAEQFLFQEYLKEHFGMYQTMGADAAAQKPSVISYEQEYLLAGKTSDQENIASVISRIIFLRMIFDFVSVLSNKAVREEAKLAAISLVGFTGLPVLVSITQVLIMLIWAFAEALLDTSALMMGKEVPIMKKNVVMTFPELFLLNREYLKQKASSMADTEELSFSYQDYLRTFLLLKGKKELAYRSMDLIQVNVKLRYDTDSFQLENCLYGYAANADFVIANKFTSFTFLQKFINSDFSGFRFSVKAGNSY